MRNSLTIGIFHQKHVKCQLEGEPFSAISPQSKSQMQHSSAMKRQMEEGSVRITGQGNATMRNCNFMNSFAARNGGAILVTNRSVFTLSNSILSGNLRFNINEEFSLLLQGMKLEQEVDL